MASQRQEEKSEDTRARLRAATEQLLVEIGYGSTSTAKVCAKSRLSRGALLHHYPTRHDLIVDTARHFWQRAETSMGKLAEALALGKLNIRSFIVGVFEQAFGSDRIAVTLELMVASRSDERLRAEISKMFVKLLIAYEDGAVRALSRSDLSQQQIHVIMTLVTSTVRGLRVQEVVLDDRKRIADTLDSLIYAVEQIFASGPKQFTRAFQSSRRVTGYRKKKSVVAS